METISTRRYVFAHMYQQMMIKLGDGINVYREYNNYFYVLSHCMRKIASFLGGACANNIDEVRSESLGMCDND